MSLQRYVGVMMLDAQGQPLTSGVTVSVSFDGGTNYEAPAASAGSDQGDGVWAGELDATQRANAECIVKGVHTTGINNMVQLVNVALQVQEWITADDMNQLRYRLQMSSGTTAAPAADAPTQLPIDVQAWSASAAAVKIGTTSGVPNVNPIAINDNLDSAQRLEQSTLGITTFSVSSSSSSTTFTITANPPIVDTDQAKGKAMTFVATTGTAALRGQYTTVEANDITGIMTVTALSAVPQVGDKGVLT